MKVTTRSAETLAAQMAEIVGTTQTRSISVSMRALDEEKRTVELAFASTTPVENRWWNESEILEVTAAAIRGHRLDNGAALLVDHNRRDQVGVVESWTVDEAEGVARAVVRFSRSIRGEEIFRDVIDEIRRLVSFGYIVHAVRLLEQVEGHSVWEVTDWEPTEISIVPVPADATVGVGRSAAESNTEEPTAPTGESGQRTTPTNQPRRTMDPAEAARLANDPTQSDPAAGVPATSTVAVTRSNEDAGAERTRCATLAAIGSHHNLGELARAAIESGDSVESFQTEVLRKLQAKPLSEALRSADIGLSEGERKRYSMIKLIRAASEPSNRSAQTAAGFELECHAAAESVRGVAKNSGFLVPDEVLRTRAFTPLNTSIAETDTGDSGGNLVADDLEAGSFISLLRNETVAMRLGRSLMGLTGNISIPKQVGAAQGFWLGEDEDITASSLSVGQVALTPRTCGARNEVTRKMLQQGSIDVEQLLRDDLASIMAQTIDHAAFYGDPDTNPKMPRGLKFTAGIGSVEWGVDTAYVDLVAAETAAAVANAGVANSVYVCNAAKRGNLKSELKFAGVAGTVWEPGNTLNGYATEVTNQLDAGDVFFGNWADFIIGMWGGLEILVDPFSGSASGKVRITAFQDVDFLARRAASFARIANPVV